MPIMEATEVAQPLIQVCGDPTVDWLSVRSEDGGGEGNYWPPETTMPDVRLSPQAGGSALLVKLLREMIPDRMARVEGVELDQVLLSQPTDSPVTTAWTVWQSYSGVGGRPAFRLGDWRECEPGRWNYSKNRLKGDPDLLVIEDSGLGFREDSRGWPQALSTRRAQPRPQHIILKLSQYGDEENDRNPLLDRLLRLGLADRTTLVTSIGDLRSCAVKVGVSLSWEKMLEDVIAAVGVAEPFVDEVGRRLPFYQVIVTIGAAGAITVGPSTNTLVFDRNGQEGDFERSHDGQMMGYNTCVVAALAAAWAEARDAVDWTETTLAGIALARLLHLRGYEPVSAGSHSHLQFPCAELAEAFWHKHAGAPLARVHEDELKLAWDLGVFADPRGVATSDKHRGEWTILQETLISHRAPLGAPLRAASRGADTVCECARNIVIRGPRQALPGVPLETVGRWRSADRKEIEGVRSVINVIGNYLAMDKPENPLSIAVFGPPGSGKSFVVKEIAKGLGLDDKAQLTFNLSQFESPDELPPAFHQIRDMHLRGMMPLVFWDEFDTPCDETQLGWLRHFLAPMQDGEFNQDGMVHPLGGGIYVFAGATRHSFADFCAGDTEEERAAKKPDFVSRLRAYIDVHGVNGSPNSVEDELYPIRRAFLLNSLLGRFAPRLQSPSGEFRLERGVLDAFLRTTRYRHGARSMSTIIQMSSLARKSKFELSSLPSENMLQMHVDMREFSAFTRMGFRESLRVGVTGHRFLDEKREPVILEAIEKAIDHVVQAYPDHYLTVLSPMALGADLMVTRALLGREDTWLIPVLAVPREEYIFDLGETDKHHEDYGSAEQRQEFRHWLSERAVDVIEMPPSATRNEAYLSTGEFIAKHCDVMIALWDGQPAKGLGGTGDVVDLALDKDNAKAVCHVWVGAHKEDKTSATDVGDKFGKLRRINFPGHEPGKWHDE